MVCMCYRLHCIALCMHATYVTDLGAREVPSTYVVHLCGADKRLCLISPGREASMGQPHVLDHRLLVNA